MKKETSQFQFSFVPVVTPRGDGSFIVTPGKPVMGRKKLKVSEAVKISGLSRATIHRLHDTGFLEGEKPSPGRTFIFEDSLRLHLERAKDKEFWDDEGRRKTYLQIINPKSKSS